MKRLFPTWEVLVAVGDRCVRDAFRIVRERSRFLSLSVGVVKRGMVGGIERLGEALVGKNRVMGLRPNGTRLRLGFGFRVRV